MIIRQRATRLFGLFLATASLALFGAEGDPEPDDYPHGSFRQECRLCHGPSAWSPAEISPEFDHGELGFVLDGAHENTPCLLCHLDLEFSSTTGNECSHCHQDIHTGELGLDCSRCHTTRSFVDRANDVRSHRLTRFPLTGGHLSLDCSACHLPIGGNPMRFANTPTDCDACHRADFEATTNPNHVEAGFPTDCSGCHSSFGWGGGEFNHALTGFPLDGAHRTIECRSCHLGLEFAQVSGACVSCHQGDYDQTTNPNHLASGFGTDCATCHGTDRWEGATFDHDILFPIYSGKHREKWDACTDCHTNPANYGFFTCLECHEHDDPGKSADDHSDVQDYAYESMACYSCHPDGRK